MVEPADMDLLSGRLREMQHVLGDHVSNAQRLAAELEVLRSDTLKLSAKLVYATNVVTNLEDTTTTMRESLHSTLRTSIHSTGRDSLSSTCAQVGEVTNGVANGDLCFCSPHAPLDGHHGADGQADDGEKSVATDAHFRRFLFGNCTLEDEANQSFLLDFPQQNSSFGRVFADAEALKEHVRESLIVPQPDPTEYFHEKGIFQEIVRSHHFETLSGVMVGLSSLWIAIDIDLNRADVLNHSQPVFKVVANIFCLFFVVELYIRVMAFKDKLRVFYEFWMIFDGLLVVLMVLDTWVLYFVVAVSKAAGSTNLRALVVFRTLRLLRVLRLARVLRELPELLVIVRGIVHATRAIGIVLSLVGFIIYVAAIVFRVLFEDTAIGADRFDSVPRAMATLLIEGTMSGQRGGPMIYSAGEESVLYAVLLFGFVLVANVTMMGVLTGLLVQTVKTVAEVEKEEKAVKGMQGQMEELWELITAHDQDSDGMISELELRHLLEDKSTAKVLHRMGVDLEGLINVCSFIFDQNEGYLTKTGFKRMVLDLRGRNTATVKDHVETRKFVHHAMLKSGLLKERRHKTSRRQSRQSNQSAVP